MKVAIIGAGNMGGAIARGMAKGTIIATEEITVANPSQGKLDALKAEFPALNVTNNNREAAEGADMVFLCVKPRLMEHVIKGIAWKEGQALVSVAAGVSFEQLFEYTGRNEQIQLYRIIPNTAINELQSMTFIASDHLYTNRSINLEKGKLLFDIFGEMGLTMSVGEGVIPAATALTSCGIAYALKYIQAAMQAGIELGIYPKEGMKMVAQTLKGAAELILNNDTHPAAEIDKVCTPGGYTIRGVNTLEHEGFTSALIKAIKSSI